MAKSEIVEFQEDGGIIAVHGAKLAKVARAVSEAAGVDGMSMSDIGKIKLPASGGESWRENRKEIIAAVVGDNERRAYWEDEYDGGNTPPDCSSDDMITGVGTPGGDCQTCPLAKFNSSTKKNSEGQACQHRRILFALTPDSVMPVILSVPPSSLKYVKKDFIRFATTGNCVAVSEGLWSFTLKEDKAKRDAVLAHQRGACS